MRFIIFKGFFEDLGGCFVSIRIFLKSQVPISDLWPIMTHYDLSSLTMTHIRALMNQYWPHRAQNDPIKPWKWICLTYSSIKLANTHSIHHSSIRVHEPWNLKPNPIKTFLSTSYSTQFSEFSSSKVFKVKKKLISFEFTAEWKTSSRYNKNNLIESS